MTVPTFPVFLEQYRDEDSRIGDLARVVLADAEWPDTAETWPAIRGRLVAIRAPFSTILTGEAVFRSYQRRVRYVTPPPAA